MNSSNIDPFIYIVVIEKYQYLSYIHGFAMILDAQICDQIFQQTLHLSSIITDINITDHIYPRQIQI